MAIRGVLFDSGNTLVRASGGRWNPRYDFEEVLLRHQPTVPVQRFKAAFAAGDAFLSAASHTTARDDYHRVILTELGIHHPSAELLLELDGPLDVPPVELYPDVAAVLSELRSRRIAMAIVTDNWGTSKTFRDTYDLLGLEGFFAAVAVSEEVGCRKPDPRMYRTASDALGLPPAECLYIDDDPELAEAASALGYVGLTICRDGASRPGHGDSITGLPELLHYLG